MESRMLINIAFIMFMALLVCVTAAKPRKDRPNCREICRACKQNYPDAFPCGYDKIKDCIKDCKSQDIDDFKCDSDTLVPSTPCALCHCENGSPLCAVVDCQPSACYWRSDFPADSSCCYSDGAKQKVNDGCNDCTCGNGEWACTEKACSGGTCNYFCTAIYKPVCGSDGKTYSNTCEMGRAACKQMTEITVEHDGECGQEPSLM